MLNRKLLTALDLRCRMPIDAFRTMGDCVDTVDGPMIHIDRGCNVLAVAHLDYVLWAEPRINGLRIHCPQLDDRLGVWAILDLLPAMGIHCDILLTDSEEIGRSTARHFAPPKEYNWIFQFDRHGMETVLYSYDSPDNREILREHDFTIGQGSFSDICFMESLGVTGFNVGTGYYREHSSRCYGNLAETLLNADRFASFHREWSETLIPSPIMRRKQWGSLAADQWQSWGASDDAREDGDPWYVCECGEYNLMEDPACVECGEPSPPIPEFDHASDWNEFVARFERET